jgi:acetylglutamate kinase
VSRRKKNESLRDTARRFLALNAHEVGCGRVEESIVKRLKSMQGLEAQGLSCRDGDFTLGMHHPMTDLIALPSQGRNAALRLV